MQQGTETGAEEARLASGQVAPGSSAESASGPEAADDRVKSPQLEAVHGAAAAVQTAEQKQGITSAVS